jgi:hypothetical protein
VVAPPCVRLKYLIVVGLAANMARSYEVRAEPGGELSAIPPTVPDVPPRKTSPHLAPTSGLRSTADLDGTYLWLGPVGAAGYVDREWDSAFGGDVTVIRIREHRRLGAIGGSAGGEKWTKRDGGRAWVEGVVGTRVGGRAMLGVSAGAIAELANTSHPRPGAMVGVWGYFGVTPYVRAGMVESLGGFVEIGVHIALPVVRR